MKYFKTTIFFLLFPILLNAQIGGNHTYKFLDLTNSARAASLGGNIISIQDADLALTFHNPSLLNDKMLNNFVLNYVNYFAGINYGYVSYANKFNKIGNIAIGLHYINYGTFTEANEFGEKLGEFKASEYAFNIIWSKKIDSLFTYGVNFKPIISTLEQYTSVGAAIDAGITYHSNARLLTAALVVKNFGTQITTYTENNREPLPFEIQFGISKGLAHAPFRLTLLYRHLEKWNLSYDLPNEETTNIFDVEEPVENDFDKFSDNLFRHAVIGIEFIPFESFFFNFSYNHQRRQELSLEQIGAMTGFSWGFGLNLTRFNISYGRSSYHVAGASNHFSFSAKLSNFYRKKEKTTETKNKKRELKKLE